MDIFLGKVNSDYTVQLYNLRFNQDFLNKYIGKDVEIEVRLEAKTRSDKQNKWYWGVAIPTIIGYLKEFDGVTYSKEEIHEFILKNIVKPEVKVSVVMGQQLITYAAKTTSKMSTVEFNVFKESLQLYFAEKGIIIPDPV
jgi:hypothetical protein